MNLFDDPSRARIPKPRHLVTRKEPDPLRMWALVGWYVAACLIGAAFFACWGWT